VRPHVELRRNTLSKIRVLFCVKREKIMDAAESKPSIAEAATKSSIPETAAKTLEGDIRSLVRGNRATDAPGSSDDAVAAGAASIADIEKLMAELLVARDFLQAEGDRIRRINSNYRRLAETASASVKIIAETIGKWRISDDPANQASKVVGHLRPQAHRG
jgi:hypothetical protein